MNKSIISNEGEKMKNILRSMAVVMTLSLCLSIFSAVAFADGVLCEGGFEYTVADGKATIVGAAAAVSGELEIPAQLGGYAVAAIGERAFADQTGIVELKVPSAVKTIGDYAFYRCYGLTALTIDFGAMSIGEHAFDACTALTYAFIPTSVESIGDYAFSMCAALTSVTVPASVSVIGENSFKHCDAMRGVYVTDGSVAHTYLAHRKVDLEMIDGDADGDGALTNTDITQYVRYLSGVEMDETFDPYKLDLYTDGKLSNRDAIYCIQKLTGWR